MSSPPEPVNGGGSAKARRLDRSKSREDLENEKVRQAELEVTHLLDVYEQNGDLHGLAAFARREGIPDKFRKKVWPILLEHHPLLLRKNIELQVVEGTRDGIPYEKIGRDVKRYWRSLNKEPGTRGPSPPSSISPVDKGGSPDSTSALDPAAMDNMALETAARDAIIAFLETNEDVHYESGMSYVCLSLADWLLDPPCVGGIETDQPKLLAKCFGQMMSIMLWTPQKQPNPVELGESFAIKRIAIFSSMLRKLCPGIRKILQEEDVLRLGEDWLFTWIKWWCARELRKADKGRLWDWYLGIDQVLLPVESEFSIEHGLMMAPECLPPCYWHIFVCIALLENSKDEVDELEHSELSTLFSRLPPADMNAIIEEAKSLHQRYVDIDTEESDAETYSRFSEES